MLRAQAGDAAAYRQLLRAALPLLRQAIADTVPDQASRDGALLAAIMTIHQLRHTYEANRPLRPWLLAIGRGAGRAAASRR